MSLVFHIIEEEYNRLNDYLKIIENKLKNLPKGSLSEKVIKGRSYYYLAYRKDGKVRFDYLGKKNSEKFQKISEEVKERKELEKQIKEVKKNIIEIKRVLNGSKSRTV